MVSDDSGSEKPRFSGKTTSYVAPGKAIPAADGLSDSPRDRPNQGQNYRHHPLLTALCGLF